MAGCAPEGGLWLRELSLGSINLPGLGATKISLSLFMLSLLLFNAGLGIKAQELKGLQKKWQLLLWGIAANAIMPIILVFSLNSLLGLWHSNDELQNLLVGLALVIAMPIAGSSTAWSQNANGNLGLSLGLVFFSTLASPITAPLVLHAFAHITGGDYAEDLHELASQGTNTFLCLVVVAPALIGLFTNQLLGEQRVAKIKPHIKLINFLFLLLLNYSNASTSLPEVFKRPDWDFLALVLMVTSIVCAISFFAGWLIARIFKGDKGDKAALMFGLGMNNNGTGLVLASTALYDHPAVMLPVIFYTLVQQVIAALVDRKIFKAED